jgi:hypothetical protein
MLKIRHQVPLNPHLRFLPNLLLDLVVQVVASEDQAVSAVQAERHSRHHVNIFYHQWFSLFAPLVF